MTEAPRWLRVGLAVTTLLVLVASGGLGGAIDGVWANHGEDCPPPDTSPDRPDPPDRPELPCPDGEAEAITEGEIAAG